MERCVDRVLARGVGQSPHFSPASDSTIDNCGDFLADIRAEEPYGNIDARSIRYSGNLPLEHRWHALGHSPLFINVTPIKSRLDRPVTLQIGKRAIKWSERQNKRAILHVVQR